MAYGYKEINKEFAPDYRFVSPRDELDCYYDSNKREYIPTIRYFLSVGDMKITDGRVVITDQDGKAHSLTLKQGLCWSQLKRSPLEEEEYIHYMLKEIKNKKLGIYMDKEDALDILDSLIAKGLVIMGVGDIEDVAFIDLYSQIKFKENEDFSEIIKFLSLRGRFGTIISLYKCKRSPAVKKILKLFKEGYTTCDIIRKGELTEDVLPGKKAGYILPILESLINGNIIVEDGCISKKYSVKEYKSRNDFS